MNTNTNPETGIRYGVIAIASLDGDVVQELWYGPNAVDESYAEAYAEATSDARSNFEMFLSDAEMMASEVDPNMGERDRENFISNRLHTVCDTDDVDTYVERQLGAFSDSYECDEPRITGTYDCVRYMISWLGGAPLLWVFEGPLGLVRSLCSPCAPNAADLDSDFVIESDALPEHTNDWYMSYVVPYDWLPRI